MKKILKKVGSGLSKLRNTKAKIIITATLNSNNACRCKSIFPKSRKKKHWYIHLKTVSSIDMLLIITIIHIVIMQYHGWVVMLSYCMDYDVKNSPNGTGLQYIGN